MTSVFLLSTFFINKFKDIQMILLFNRLGRYIFFQNMRMTLLISSVLISAIWLTQSLRFIDYIMTKGLSFVLFIKLSSFLIPSLISTIFPIAFFIACLFIFSKLYSDNELVVMRSLGLSNFKIINPFLMGAFFITLILYAVNFYVHPMAKTNFNELRNDIRNNLSGKWIQPGVFININGLTFYTKQKTSSGDMKGIFFHDARNPKSVSTITAQLGQIQETANGLKFILYHGTRQSTSNKTHKPSILTFERYSVDVENVQPQKKRRKDANELSMAELFKYQGSSPHQQENQKRRRIEAHERILLPLVVFPFALLAGLVFLLGDYNRRGKTQRLAIGISGALIIEVGLFFCINLFQRYESMIYVAYTTLLSLNFLFLWFLLKSPRKTNSRQKPDQAPQQQEGEAS